MQRNLTKILIIILAIIIIAVSVSGIILYIKTDLFKSDEKLFKKYISQSVEDIAEILDVSTERQYLKILNENDYSESSNITLKYLENKNDREEIYNINETGIINNSKQETYRKITSNYKDEEILQIEATNQDNIYAIRLSNVVKQFISVENLNLSYLISSMGYDGRYFSEKLNNVDISGLLEFTPEETEILKKTYINVIFADINKEQYSSKKNVMITLSNGESVTTTSYTLSINKNELDKIYKRILNQAVADQIILSKIDEIDSKIKETGFIEPEGESLKEIYTAKLQKTSKGLEYSGEDNRKIEFKVFQTKGQTVRTEIATETKRLIIDTANINQGESINIRTEKLTDEGTDTKKYTLSKEDTNEAVKRKLIYEDSKNNMEIEFSSTNNENKLNFLSTLNYSSDNISNINIEGSTDIEIGTDENIPRIDKESNIILNEYDGDKIIAILDNLKGRAIKSLEKTESNIKTKMMNNILIWIDEREQKIESDKLNNTELEKQRFNNKFELYAGTDLKYEHVQKLIKAVSNNMKNYRVSGNKIEIIVESGAENQEKAEEISQAITDKHTYNVEIKHSEDGYVSSIYISAFKK